MVFIMRCLYSVFDIFIKIQKKFSAHTTKDMAFAPNLILSGIGRSPRPLIHSIQKIHFNSEKVPEIKHGPKNVSNFENNHHN